MSNHSLAVWGMLASALVACSSVPTEPVTEHTTQAVTVDPDDASEFKLSANASRFALGSGVTQRSEFRFEKTVGSDGVIAIDDTNGSTHSIPSAHAASLLVGAYGTTMAQHHDAVRAYLITAGLPADQIGSISGHAGGARTGSGLDMTSGADVIPRMRFSVINRAIHGIAVPDSVAWVQMNAKGEVVAEAVYWPRIPGAVVRQAQAFAASLAGEGAAYRAKLPPEVPDGQVTIRHASVTMQSADPLPVVAFDVIDDHKDTGMAIPRHFDPQGNEIRLPQEKRPAPATPPRK